MFKKIQLKNGMRVLLIESHKSPVISIQMWVKTGSADEHKGIEGISHFIEHLVFKGTRKFKVGEIAGKIEGSGGELNAYTSFDQTVFYVTLSKHFDEVGLEAISEMMGFPAFDEKEIDNEREVVIEEIKRGNDNPHRQASRMLFETVYKKHSYGVPVIGFEENIRKVKKKELLAYYHSRYVPQNMTLVVVGNFNTKEMTGKVEKYFGPFEKYKLKKVIRKKEPKQTRPRIVVKKEKFEESLLYIAWRIPATEHKDIPALDVLALILGQGDSSRLNRRLRIDNHLVNYIGSSSFTPLDPGFFAVSASLNIKDLAGILREIKSTLAEFVESGPSAEEMTKAIINMNSEDFYSLETVDGMARKFGTYEHLFGDYKYFKKFLSDVNRLKAEDILRVAKKYISPEALTITLMTPGDEAEATVEIKKFLSELKSALKQKKSVKKIKTNKVGRFAWYPKAGIKAGSDKLEKIVLPTGTTLILRPNKDTPVISLRCAFLGGLRIESEAKTGLTEMLSRVWMAGAGELSEAEIHSRIEGLASSISSFGGRNSAGLTMTTLAPLEKEIFPVFEKILLEPKFSPESIEREKKQIYEYLRTRKDNPAQLAILSFMQAMFGKHPYGRDPHGTEESIQKIDRKDLFEHLKQMGSSQNMTIAIVGDIDVKKWRAQLERVTQKLTKGKKIDVRHHWEKPKDNLRLFQKSEKEQAHIVLGFAGLSFTDPRRYALQVLQSILAGQGGRLFLELRDKASLAYSVSPVRMEGIEGGYFGAYIGCSPEKSETAIRMMKEEFNKLMNEPVSETEMDRAKRYLIGRHDIDLQRNSSLSAAVLFDDLYGAEYNETFKFATRISRVTPADVQKIAQEIFEQKEVLSVVSPRQPW